jgi:excisionase family DNA binding protein
MTDISIIQLNKEELKTLIQEAIKYALATVRDFQLSNTQEQLLTREETADLLKISLPTLDSYTRKGIIHGYRLGTVVRYKGEEVKSSLKEIPTNKYKRY